MKSSSGVAVKFPMGLIQKLGYYVRKLLLYTCFVCVGILIGLFLSISNTAKHMKQSVIEIELQTNRMVEAQAVFQEWKKLVDDRFTEQEGLIRRLNALMRVPKSERNKAALNYKYFNYGIGEQ